MHNTKFPVPIKNILFIAVGISFLISCSSGEISPWIDKGEPKPEEPKPTPAALPEEKPSPARPLLEPPSDASKPTLPISQPMAEHTYTKIAQKVADAQYQEALDDLDKFVRIQVSGQVYTMEAQILRLIILSGFRAAYLHLGNAYHLGWKKVLQMPDKALPAEERIKKLGNLSQSSLGYYRKHKESAVHLLRAYEQFKKFYPVVGNNQFRLIAYPLKKSNVVSNTLLERIIKDGEWFPTSERIKTEQIEINNCMVIFWLSLMGVKDIAEANRLLNKGAYIVDERGLFYWLAKSLNYRTEPVRPESFMEEPELAHILEKKASEAQDKFKELLKQSNLTKNPFREEMFNPLPDLPKHFK